MNSDEMLEQVLALVQRQGRVSYRAIKRRFDVDDDYLADLREEILFTHPHIREEEGRGLVWIAVPAPREGLCRSLLCQTSHRLRESHPLWSCLPPTPNAGS